MVGYHNFPLTDRRTLHPVSHSAHLGTTYSWKIYVVTNPENPKLTKSRAGKCSEILPMIRMARFTYARQEDTDTFLIDFGFKQLTSFLITHWRRLPVCACWPSRTALAVSITISRLSPRVPSPRLHLQPFVLPIRSA
jgi:hypothetical protein